MKSKSKTPFAASAFPTHVVFSFGLVVAGPGIQSTRAADRAWSSSPVSAIFSGVNWTPGQVPGAASSTAASTDSLYFGTSTVTSLVNDNTTPTYAGLTFSSGAAAFTTLGNAVTLSGGITNNSSMLHTITNALALSATQTVDTNPGNMTLNGIISGAAFGLTKANSGTLTLTGVNTYTGANTINSGTVAIAADTNLGATAATVGLNGATLKVNPGATVTNTHAVTISGTNTIQVNSPSISAFTYFFNTASTLAGGGALTVTGNGSLDVSGQNTGILVLNAANTALGYTGTLTMQSGGLLELNNNAALPSTVTVALNGNGGVSVNNAVTAMASNVTVTNAGNVLNFGNGIAGTVTGNIMLNGDLTVGLRDWYNWAMARSGAINGIISGAGGLNVISPGAILTLGAANIYSGPTNVYNSGLTLTANATSSIATSSGVSLVNSTLTASYAGGIADKLKDTGKVSIRNNAFINLTGSAADTTETVGVLELAGGNNTINIATSGTAVTTLAASSLNRTNLGTGLLIGSSLGQQNSAVSKISLTTPPGGANLVGAGGAATGTGAVKNLGIIPWLSGNPTAAGTAGRELVTYDTTLGSLRALVTNEYDAAGTIAGATTGNNVKSDTVSESGLASATLNALLLAPAADQSVTGTGGSTLTLSSGSLTSAMSSGAVGTTGFNSTISGFAAVAFGNGEAVVRIAQASGTITINSPITVTSGGGLTKTGPGTLTLGAANTYTGPTTICQTTLATSVNNVFNGITGTPMVLSNNAQLNVGATTQKIATLTCNGAGNGGGSVIGTGTVNLGGNVTYETSGINQNAGVTLSVGNLNLNGNRVFSVGDAQPVTGAEMTISSNIVDGTSSSSLTKSGAGILLLSGTNTYGGGTTISGGVLQVGNAATAGSITGNVLNNATLIISRSDAVNFPGNVTGTGDLVQAGTGTTTLAGPNISSGKIVIRGGTLSVPALTGTAPLEIGSATLAVGLTYTGSGETTNRALTLTGTTGGVTLTQNGTGLLKFSSDLVNAVNGGKIVTLGGTGNGEFAGRLVDSPSGSAGVTAISKAGTGTWTLSGPNTHTGSFNVTAGTLNLSGSLGNNASNGQFRVGTAANVPAILNVLPGAAASRLNLFVGDAGTGTGGGAVYQSGGSLVLTQAVGVDPLRIGSSATGYGYYKLSGGTISSTRPAIGASLADTVGVLEVTGGTFTSTEQTHIAAGSATSSGLINVTGGSVVAGTDIRMLALQAGTAGATQQAVLNVGGGGGPATVTTGNSASQGVNLAQAGTIAGELGVVNLLTNGTLNTGRVLGTQINAITHFNFNGGTLKATPTNNVNIFGDATLDAVNVYSGGGTIDNNGTPITINRALLLPANFGVSGTSIPVPSGGTGCIGAPLVKFTGGSGTGATGYAVVTAGVVTSITVTSPGIGYLVTDTLTASFFGGGAATAAAAVTGIAVAANTSGGMTFQGSGTTTLSGVNTYTGTTTVTGGILAVNGTALADSGKLVINGGKVQPTGMETVNTLFFGATQQAYGTWGATGSTATHIDDARFAGTTGVVNVLTGAGGGGYATWASANAAGQAADLDFDHDGVKNGAEFFFGATGSTFTANPALVSGTITWPKSGSFSGTYKVETSTDLVNWTDVTSSAVDNGTSVTYTPTAGQPKRFVRLKVNPS